MLRRRFGVLLTDISYLHVHVHVVIYMYMYMQKFECSTLVIFIRSLSHNALHCVKMIHCSNLSIAGKTLETHRMFRKTLTATKVSETLPRCLPFLLKTSNRDADEIELLYELLDIYFFMLTLHLTPMCIHDIYVVYRKIDK